MIIFTKTSGVPKLLALKDRLMSLANQTSLNASPYSRKLATTLCAIIDELININEFGIRIDVFATAFNKRITPLIKTLDLPFYVNIFAFNPQSAEFSRLLINFLEAIKVSKDLGNIMKPFGSKLTLGIQGIIHLLKQSLMVYEAMTVQFKSLDDMLAIIKIRYATFSEAITSGLPITAVEKEYAAFVMGIIKEAQSLPYLAFHSSRHFDKPFNIVDGQLTLRPVQKSIIQELLQQEKNLNCSLLTARRYYETQFSTRKVQALTANIDTLLADLKVETVRYKKRLAVDKDKVHCLNALVESVGKETADTVSKLTQLYVLTIRAKAANMAICLDKGISLGVLDEILTKLYNNINALINNLNASNDIDLCHLLNSSQANITASQTLFAPNNTHPSTLSSKAQSPTTPTGLNLNSRP